MEAYRRTRTPLFTYESAGARLGLPDAGLLGGLRAGAHRPLRDAGAGGHPAAARGARRAAPADRGRRAADLLQPGAARAVRGRARPGRGRGAHPHPAGRGAGSMRPRGAAGAPGAHAGLPGAWAGAGPATSCPRPRTSGCPRARRSSRPNTELRSMFLIEPERGCSRGCHYCVMRRTTNGGMRTVPPERVLSLIPEHARRVGLVGAAVTDHPRIVELLRTLVDSGREVGISSLRADRLTQELVDALRRGGAAPHRGRRTAPRSGCATWSTASTRRSRSSARRSFARDGGDASGSRSTTWSAAARGGRGHRRAGPLHHGAVADPPGGARRGALRGQAQHAAGRRALRGHPRGRGEARAAAPRPQGAGRGAADLRALGLGRVHARAVRPGGGAGRDGRVARRAAASPPASAPSRREAACRTWPGGWRTAGATPPSGPPCPRWCPLTAGSSSPGPAMSAPREGVHTWLGPGNVFRRARALC